MDFQEIIRDYWPFLALILWFGYKRWKSQKVKSMLPTLRAQGAVEIDVRSPAEFAQSNCPGSINIPVGELANRLDEIPRDRPVILCCASGGRSGMAKMILTSKGFTNIYNIGAWTNLL